MGIIENKLILKDVLAALGIPFMTPLYGSLAHEFDEHQLRTAVRHRTSHAFVLKPLTDGASHGVRVFDAASWVEKGAVEFGHLHPGKQQSHHYDYTASARGSEDVLINEARRIITKATEWGQKYAVGDGNRASWRCQP